MKGCWKFKKEIEGKTKYKCNCCNNWLSDDFFRKDANNKSRDGLTSRCTNCLRKSQRKITKKQLYCSKCANVLNINEFSQTQAVNILSGESGYCKQCFRNFRELRYKNLNNDELLESVMHVRLHGMKQRSIRKNLDFTVNISDLINLWRSQKGLCAISGKPMELSYYGNRTPFRVSVDRIDSTKGYVKENIQFVCDIVNRMKAEYSVGELFSWCQDIINYNNYKNGKYLK